jgi:hypothetical protein
LSTDRSDEISEKKQTKKKTIKIIYEVTSTATAAMISNQKTLLSAQKPVPTRLSIVRQGRSMPSTSEFLSQGLMTKTIDDAEMTHRTTNNGSSATVIDNEMMNKPAASSKKKTMIMTTMITADRLNQANGPATAAAIMAPPAAVIGNHRSRFPTATTRPQQQQEQEPDHHHVVATEVVVELAFNDTRPTEHFGSVVGLKEPVQGTEKTQETAQGAEKTQTNKEEEEVVEVARAADKVEEDLEAAWPADKVEEKVEVEVARAADKVEQANGTVTTTKKEKSAATTANGIISVDGGRAATDCFTLQIRDVSVMIEPTAAAVSAATTKDADQQQLLRQRTAPPATETRVVLDRTVVLDVIDDSSEEAATAPRDDRPAAAYRNVVAVVIGAVDIMEGITDGLFTALSSRLYGPTRTLVAETDPNAVVILIPALTRPGSKAKVPLDQDQRKVRIRNTVVKFEIPRGKDCYRQVFRRSDPVDALLTPCKPRNVKKAWPSKYFVDRQGQKFSRETGWEVDCNGRRVYRRSAFLDPVSPVPAAQTAVTVADAVDCPPGPVPQEQQQQEQPQQEPIVVQDQQGAVSPATVAATTAKHEATTAKEAFTIADMEAHWSE